MLRKLLRRRQRERDLNDEIRFHLEREVQLRRDSGETPDAADRAARRDFGSITLVKEVTRAMWGWTSLERIVQDLRIAGRGLRRSPGYVAVVVATLALGIGATTALFTVVNSVLLRPLPFPEPDRLVMVWERPPFRDVNGGQAITRNLVQPQNYLDWRARHTSFEAIAALQGLPMNVSGSGDAEQVPGLRVTGEFFSVLGVSPLLGRGIERGEDAPGGPRTAVLTYGFWQQRYGGDRSILGTKIDVNGFPVEVVGVMPPGFSLPGVRAQLFVPLVIDPALAPQAGRFLQTIARLKRTVSLTDARASMEAIVAETARERPDRNDQWGATVLPLAEEAVGDVRRPLLILFGAVTCVLLIACANVVNLGLMRGAVRTHEMAIRTALGAGRGRLMHQLVVENLLIAGLGGILGVALAHQGVRAILAMFPANFQLPRAQEIGVDGRVLAFASIATLGIGLLVAVAPGLQALRRNLVETLHGAGRSIAAGSSRFRAMLVVAEVSLAVVVVIGAGLMTRSLVRLYSVNPGFQTERVLTMRMLLQGGQLPGGPARTAGFVNEILERVRAIPGVAEAGTIHRLPLTSFFASSSGWSRADQPEPPRDTHPNSEVSVITPGYFRTMGIPIIAGRNFDSQDRPDVPHVAIINQTLANRYFPGEDPVGKRIRLRWGPTLQFEIVGVAGDSRTGLSGGGSAGLREQPGSIVFLNNAQEPSPVASLVVRTTGVPLATVKAVREQIRAVNPNQGVSDIQTMEQVVSDSIANIRLQTILLGAFAALALVLASVGLYGVISYSVEHRRREMGVRVALGAGRGSILRLVLGQGLRLTAAGLAVGLSGAVAVTRYLETLLYEVQSTDPGVFAAVFGGLIATAMVACYVPARRATRVDPAVVLRDE
jgi:putative ABC transport system permease protein